MVFCGRMEPGKEALEFILLPGIDERCYQGELTARGTTECKKSLFNNNELFAQETLNFKRFQSTWKLQEP